MDFVFSEPLAPSCPLTFSCDDRRGIVAARPSSADSACCPAGRWQRLADQLALEPGLNRYRAETLYDRWRQGRAAIALAGGEIVSYVSLIPLFDAETEARLGRRFGGVPEVGGGFELHESATGWTHVQWRRRGISLHLRRALLSGFSRTGRLFASATIGLGASRVMPGLGWRLASWGDHPFVSALLGVPAAGLATGSRCQARQPGRLRPYLGSHITPQENPGHHWPDYCHLWFSDAALAAAFDRRLAALAGGELARWREVVAEEVYARPQEPGWRPFLFRERY